MSRREKALAVIIGALLLLVGVWYVASQVGKGLYARRRENDTLRRRVEQFKTTIRRGQQADKRIRELELRSLPRDPEVARSLYQAWLLDTVEKTGLAEPKVVATSGLSRADVYRRLTFSVSGRCDLQQLVKLLHQFYSVNDLHQIRRLRIRSWPESRDLEISFSVEALVLPGSQRGEAVANVTADPLTHGGLQQYDDVIVRRNLFGPPNKPPVLSDVPSERRIELGRTVSFTARARDPDENDRLRFRLDDGAPTGASIGETSGEFRWTPKELGEYAVTVHAADDGMPSKSDSQAVRITVVEPSPPPEEPKVVERPKLRFDDAKHAYLTAIMTNGAGRKQLWLTIRTTGEILKLHEGDQISVGSVRGVVRRIREKDIEVQAEERRLVVSLGDNLFDGSELPTGGT
jgi:hypothetical protein